MSAQLDPLKIEHRFFDATDGRALLESELERLAPQSALFFDRRLTPGEIGAAASHFAVIRQLAAEDHDFACVMEDDAVLGPDVGLFLDPDTLRALPAFDVLRLVSDPARWKRPAWKIAQMHGRGIYAMARVGFGLQGQVYSRLGLQKLVSQLGAIRAPVDFMFYHDCMIRRLRVVEVRPGLIQHEELSHLPHLQALGDVGVRSAPDRSSLPFSGRMKMRWLRERRRFMAATDFVKIWGVGGLARILSWWPPGSYFR